MYCVLLLWTLLQYVSVAINVPCYLVTMHLSLHFSTTTTYTYLMFYVYVCIGNRKALCIDFPYDRVQRNESIHDNLAVWFSLSHSLVNCWRRRCRGIEEIFSALASIPKTISIGNVRITNWRYNARPLHCKESRELHSPADREKPFSDRRCLPPGEIVFPIDIPHTKDTIPSNSKNNNEFRRTWHIRSDTIRIRAKVYV